MSRNLNSLPRSNSSCQSLTLQVVPPGFSLAAQPSHLFEWRWWYTWRVVAACCCWYQCRQCLLLPAEPIHCANCTDFLPRPLNSSWGCVLKIPFFERVDKQVSPLRPMWTVLQGSGTSNTDWTRNLKRCDSTFQTSAQIYRQLCAPTWSKCTAWTGPPFCWSKLPLPQQMLLLYWNTYLCWLDFLEGVYVDVKPGAESYLGAVLENLIWYYTGLWCLCCSGPLTIDLYAIAQHCRIKQVVQKCVSHTHTHKERLHKEPIRDTWTPVYPTLWPLGLKPEGHIEEGNKNKWWENTVSETREFLDCSGVKYKNIQTQNRILYFNFDLMWNI